MDVRGATGLVLGGAGLVGRSIVRTLAREGPRCLVIASLRRDEAEEAVAELGAELGSESDVKLEAKWGNLFWPNDLKDRTRSQVLEDPEALSFLVGDLFGELTEEVFARSALGSLLLEVRPDFVVDCVNTAGALAYQNVFNSAADLRARAREGGIGPLEVDGHLATLYLPQLIRHVQVALEGMKRVGTRAYVKIGTAGTGGMGLNIPFTHSEERPSRVLLAKAGVAGAHSLLLYLMARTPGAPSVKEIKPTAAISWKSIGTGEIQRGGEVVRRADAVEGIPLSETFGEGAAQGWAELDEPLTGVYLDAGENGLFSVSEFETLTALGLMEFVTPEEIAGLVLAELIGHPTGRDVVGALDAATMGPTYRAGVLRHAALERMEMLEEARREEAVAYEMLGPPRLSKLLFEATILKRLYGTLEAARALVPLETAERAQRLLEEDADLRQRIVTVGLPILLPDAETVLRGPRLVVQRELPEGREVERVLAAGWIDLRAVNWARWRERVEQVAAELEARPSVDEGSLGDHEYGDDRPEIRPGRLAAWIFRVEDRGERIKR